MKGLWLAVACTVLCGGVASADAARSGHNPCAALGSWETSARVTADRSTVKRSVPELVWRVLDGHGFYVCNGNRAESGHLYADAYKAPIAAIGHRIWIRILAEQDSHAGAVTEARDCRAAFGHCFGGYGRSPRVLATKVVGRFLILTVTTIRTR